MAKEITNKTNNNNNNKRKILRLLATTPCLRLIY